MKVEEKCGVRQLINIILCHICAKGFLDLNFNKAVIIDQKWNFHEIAPNFKYSQNS